MAVSNAGEWYDRAEQFWHELPGTEYLIPSETEEVYSIFLEFLKEVNEGYSPEQSMAFWELLDQMGWDYDTFDWEDFREWYDSVAA